MSLSTLRCLAAYNQWADAKLLTKLSNLSSAALIEDRQGFFGGLSGVLNHRIAADKIWHGRLMRQDVSTLQLDTHFSHEMAEIQALMKANASNWISYVEGLSDPLTTTRYRTMAGLEFDRPTELVLTHIFNHAPTIADKHTTCCRWRNRTLLRLISYTFWTHG